MGAGHPGTKAVAGSLAQIPGHGRPSSPVVPKLFFSLFKLRYILMETEMNNFPTLIMEQQQADKYYLKDSKLSLEHQIKLHQHT
jgi:hypothetical protein